MRLFNIFSGRGQAAAIGSGARPCVPPPANRPKHHFIGLTPLRRNATMQGLTPLLVWVWLAAVFCIGTGVAQAALSEGFNGTGWGTSYGTYTVNSWTLNSVFRDTTTKYEGAAAIRFATTAGTRNIISPSNSGGIGTVSFWHRRWSAADGTVGFSVYISTNGTAWSSAVGSGSSTSDTYSQIGRAHV